MNKHIKELTAEKLAAKIDVGALEKELPPKTARSHHVLIKLDNISKAFVNGNQQVRVLFDIDLNFYAGEFAVIYGPSGCGKSTLLHSILGLEKPSRGKVWLRDVDLYQMTNDERANFRREKIGMVFQRSEWIKALTVWENVAYPLLLSGKTLETAKDKAVEVLEEVGMAALKDQLPSELSGGQQQRVAMARALVTDPWIIIADEPTGNLDTLSSVELVKILVMLNRTKERMILMVTHDVGFLPLATRRIGMIDGRVVRDEVDSPEDLDLALRQKVSLDGFGAYIP